MTVGVGHVIAERYRLTEILGQGGMGTVYRAVDERLGRDVALKLLHPTLTSADFRTRFEREATLLAKVSSPHIVAIYDHGEADGLLFIVTQLLPDQDLQRHLKRYGALGAARGLTLCAQVAEGLADAHAAGVVHRDVKPANVFLWRRHDGIRAHLGDFGIAQDGSSGLTATGGVIGSLAYMAPERHLGQPADARGDIYSLGCLLYATTTGDAPYSGTDFQLMNAHINDPAPQVPEDVPGADTVNAVLDRCLRKEPDERFQSAAELLEALRGATASVGPADTPEPVAAPISDVVEPGGDDTIIKSLAMDTLIKDASLQARAAAGPWSPSHVDGSPTPSDEPAPQDSLNALWDRRNTPRRRPSWKLTVAALAVVALIGGPTAVLLASGSAQTSPDPAAGPTTSLPSSTTESASPPAPPKVRAEAGYRSVIFHLRSGGTVQQRTESGWVPVRGNRFRVDAAQGGDRVCRTLRRVDTSSGPSDSVRTCGVARAKTVAMVKVPGNCVLSDGTACRYYAVKVAGFPSRAKLPVRLRTLSGAPLCADCELHAVPVGKDGRGVLTGQFHTDGRAGEFKVPLDFPDFKLIVAGLEQRVSVD